MKMFGTIIFDSEGAFTSLKKLSSRKIENDASEKSISEAIHELHNVLQSDDLVFYISTGRKLFEKRNGKTKRIR